VKILKSGLLGLALLTAAGSLGRAQQVVFNFENDAVGTPTPFTDAVNGLSATFTSNPDPSGGFNGFLVDNTIGLPSFSGNVLNENQGVHSYATLTITFSRPVNDFFLNFGLNDPNAALGTDMDVLNLVAFNGVTQVGQSTNLGQLVAGDQSTRPVGIALYDGTPFDSVSLSSPIDLFAIDNLSVETVVPEPSTISLWILGAGCILFGLWRRSRNQALCPASTTPAKSSIG
jgi:hypothetical protein